MNRNKGISLADALECSASSVAFYDKYRGKIEEIRTVQERNGILSDMQQDFEREVRQEPKNRDKLSEVYQLLSGNV